MGGGEDRERTREREREMRGGGPSVWVLWFGVQVGIGVEGGSGEPLNYIVAL